MAQQNHQIRAVISDFDDTIRDSGTGYIPESFWECRDRLRARGIEVIIATGRVRHSLASLMTESELSRLTLSPGVFTNGSVIFDREGTSTVLGSFSELEANEIFEFLKVLKHAGVKLDIGVSGLKGSYGYVKDGEKALSVFLTEGNHPISQIRAIFEEHDDIPVSFCWLCEDSTTNLCVRDLIVKVFPSLANPDSLFEFSRGFMIDPRVGKATAVRTLLKQLQINDNEVIVIGDGTNDISMLDSFEHSIVMGNASEYMRTNHGKHVAPRLEEDGWARGVEGYLDSLSASKADRREVTTSTEPVPTELSLFTSCTAS